MTTDELQTSFKEFQAAGLIVEIAVQWSRRPIFFVSNQALAAGLAKENINRGQVWTAKELLDVLSLPQVRKDHVCKIAAAKRIFGGVMTARFPQQ